jgi:hypothetical protein
VRPEESVTLTQNIGEPSVSRLFAVLSQRQVAHHGIHCRKRLSARSCLLPLANGGRACGESQMPLATTMRHLAVVPHLTARPEPGTNRQSSGRNAGVR